MWGRLNRLPSAERGEGRCEKIQNRFFLGEAWAGAAASQNTGENAQLAFAPSRLSPVGERETELFFGFGAEKPQT